MTAPFIIFGLPRSRTAWLSRFLTYGDVICGHEQIALMRGLDDARALFADPRRGTAETAAAPWWRLLPRYAPNARVVVVRRPVNDVLDSLLSIRGCTFDAAALRDVLLGLDSKLSQIEARLPCLSVSFAGLENEQTCADVFEYCLPYAHDHEHWARLASRNIQVNVPELMAYIEANRAALESVAWAAKYQILAQMRPAWKAAA